MRDSFIFYRSFHEAIKELTTEQQAMVVLAIMQYQFDETEPTLEGVPKAIFTLIKPQLDANNTRYANGCKGGAPKGNSNAKKQPKNNQETTEKQPNENENVNDNYIYAHSAEQSAEEKLEHNFGVLWDEYPRKLGKKDAYRHYKAIVRANKLSNQQMLSAIRKYKEYVEEQKTKEQYIMHGSTFFCSGIYDYIEDDADD